MSDNLKDALKKEGLISAKAHARVDMAALERALQDWTISTGSSRTQVRKDVRNMGLNLATGKLYGSPQQLSLSLKNGAPTVSKKQAKKYPLLKSCLVESF